MRKLVFVACLGVLLLQQETSALSLATVRVEWDQTNTVFYCPGYSETPTTLGKVREIMAKSARMGSNQTVRIVVGPKVPAAEFFRVLTLFADLGFSHVSVIDAAEDLPKEFYLRVHQFQEGTNLNNENFDRMRGVFIDGETREKKVEHPAGGDVQ